MSDAPDDVEEALHTVLAHVDKETMAPQKRVAVEQKCQAIHSLFGGDGPEAIYLEYRDN